MQVTWQDAQRTGGSMPHLYPPKGVLLQAEVGRP